MSIYLGTYGQVELQRQFDDEAIFGTVAPSDVNVAKKRFSFEFEQSQLLTGDEIRIDSTSSPVLSFISGYSARAIRKFINVDDLGGIRLYDTFADALAGGLANATALATPGSSVSIRVIMRSASFRLMAQVRSYELNTERETIDTTVLSDDFRTQISSLMSGSGRVSCFWEYTGENVKEMPHYLLQLILRTKVGSKFKGKFYLKTDGQTPGSAALAKNDAIFYEVTGILTSCAVQFSATEAVEIAADFITTGAIELKAILEQDYAILQEDGDDILLDQDSSAKLLTESSGL